MPSRNQHGFINPGAYAGHDRHRDGFKQGLSLLGRPGKGNETLREAIAVDACLFEKTDLPQQGDITIHGRYGNMERVAQFRNAPVRPRRTKTENYIEKLARACCARHFGDLV